MGEQKWTKVYLQNSVHFLYEAPGGRKSTQPPPWEQEQQWPPQPHLAADSYFNMDHQEGRGTHSQLMLYVTVTR